MNAKEFLKQYAEKQGYNTDDSTLEEILAESKIIHEERDGSHRWWFDLFRVAKIDGELIGYGWAENSGDMSIRDAGWEFDWSSVGFVDAKQVMTTTYEYRKD